MTHCYLGVDGGGTKTEALLADSEGRVVGRGLGGPSNPLFVSRDSALGSIARAVAEARSGAAGLMVPRKAVICSGNLKREFDVATLAAKLEIPEDRLLITQDQMSAFCGATGGKPGVVVLAGTGSFGMGITETGAQLVVGGWGPLLGDEGSGYYIGLSALKAVTRAYDGRGNKTLLTQLVKDHYCIEAVPDLIAAVYGKRDDRRNISAISPLVLEAARAGDEVALGIVDDAGRCLAELAKTIIRRLGMDSNEYSLVLTGGISNYGDLIRSPLRDEVRTEFKSIVMKEARFAPVIGAVIMAMKEDGLSMTEDMLNNLGRTYDRMTCRQPEG